LNTGGYRRRTYSPDSSGDEIDYKSYLPKSDKRSGFLSLGTLRSSGEHPIGHASKTVKSDIKLSKEKEFPSIFKSRFADSSDEDIEMPSFAQSHLHGAATTSFSPSSSEEELQLNGDSSELGKITEPQASTSFLGKSTLRESKFSPQGNQTGDPELVADTSKPAGRKKRWWSLGSKRSSRPPSRATSQIIPPMETQPVLTRRTSEPPQSSTPPRGSLHKFRRTSSGSVNSVQSASTWTPTTTRVSEDGPNGDPNNGTMFPRRLSGLPEVDEEGAEELFESQRENPNINRKKKKFPRLRKMFGIDD